MPTITRKITNAGHPITDCIGQPLGGVKITFQLVSPGKKPQVTEVWDATDKGMIIPRQVTVITQTVDIPGGLQIGEFEAAVWPNSRGNIPTQYRCTVDQTGVKPFYAVLVEGDLSALQWSDFMSAGALLVPAELITMQDLIRRISALELLISGGAPPPPIVAGPIIDGGQLGVDNADTLDGGELGQDNANTVDGGYFTDGSPASVDILDGGTLGQNNTNTTDGGTV